MPSGNIQGYLTVIRRATLWWNPLIVLPIWGVATHVSNPKSRNSWTTDIKKFLEIRSLYPSLPSITYIRAHFFISFLRLDTTTDKSLSVFVRIRPRYLNAIMLVSRSPYAQKATSMPAQSSSSSRLRRFFSSPLAHLSMLVWWLFRDSHGTSISR